MKAGDDLIVQLVAERTGMRIEDAQKAWLLAAVERLARQAAQPTGPHDQPSPSDDDAFIDRLIDEVTIRETFFLRELEQLRSIDWMAARRRAQAAGDDQVRVWSAGCASGEEAYTLAMLAGEALGATIPVSVLGTDISNAALACARAGFYNGRTVKRLATGHFLHHFRRERDGLSVGPRLRAVVSFRRHNLVSDPAPPPGEGRFDVIVCRNVLIHLEPRAAAATGESLVSALRPGGTLMLAPADRLCLAGSVRALVDEGGRPPGGRHVDRGKARRRHSGGRVAPRPDQPRQSRRGDLPLAQASEAEAPPGQSEEIRDAIRLADAGRLDAARRAAERAVRTDPMDVSAHLALGVIELGSDAPERAVISLRRALYLDPTVAIGAFHLGRAREATGDLTGARQAYEQALHLLDPDDPRHGWLVDQFDIVDLAEACKLRLLDLRG